MSESEAKTSTGMSPNVAGLLCYLAGWITGIIFLVLEKDNRFVRFHAMQSIAASVALMVAMFVLMFRPIIGWIIMWVLDIAAFILWIVLMAKAYRGETYKLPIVGNFAEKQVKPLPAAKQE